MRALLSQILDHLKKVADRARKAIETHDDQDIAGADVAHQPQ